MKRKNVEYLWKASCGAYLVAFLIGVIWAVWGCRWDACLYAALAAIGVGMIGLLIVGLVEDYGNPLRDEDQEERFQEMIRTLTAYLDELDKNTTEKK